MLKQIIVHFSPKYHEIVDIWWKILGARKTQDKVPQSYNKEHFMTIIGKKHKTTSQKIRFTRIFETRAETRRN